MFYPPVTLEGSRVEREDRLSPLTLTLQGGLQKNQEIVLGTWEGTVGLRRQVEGQSLQTRPLGHLQASGWRERFRGYVCSPPGCQAPKVPHRAPTDQWVLFSFEPGNRFPISRWWRSFDCTPE